MALIDFTLSNARRFYLSMGNPLGLKGLKQQAAASHVCFLTHNTFLHGNSFLLLHNKQHVLDVVERDTVNHQNQGLLAPADNKHEV